MKKNITRKYYWTATFTFWFLYFVVIAYVSPVLADEIEETQTIKVDEIEKRATEYLWDYLSEEKNNFEVKATYRGRNVVLPTGKLNFEFEIVGQHRAKAKRIPLSLNIRVDGEIKKKLRINSQARFYKDVIKTTNRMEKGHIITEEDLEVSEVDSSRVGRGTFVDPKELIGLMSNRNINSGQVLKMNMVKKPTLVKQGDRVLIMAKMGPMKITIPGIVKEKGFKGSMVRVLNTQSKKEVYGRVVDANTVRVNF
jgi:flagella basal body P-ring formation protein FlgA